MIDFRYLALTMIGMFLMLAVGLMMGPALAGPDKRDAAYEALRRDFDLLREEDQRVRDDNDVLHRRLDSRDQAMRELLPLAVRDRLSGSTVAVILCGPVDEGRFWSDLETALKLADANLGPIVRITDRMRPLSTEDRARLAHIWESGTVAGGPQPFEAAGWMVRGLARGSAQERLEDLARAAGMTFRGSYSGPVRRLLVITAASEEREAALGTGQGPEIRVVDAARDENMRVVAAEPEESERSTADPLRRRGISTVDNVDTAAGQISVVLALAGAEPGHFGSKAGATRAMPPLSAPGSLPGP